MDLLQTARLGADAEAFLASPLGRYIKDRAEREIDEAIEELVEARADDIETNTRERSRIHRARDALTWLLEAVSEGQRARVEIELREE